MHESAFRSFAHPVALLTAGLLLACSVPEVPNDPNAKVPLESAPTWKNWSGDLVHRPTTDGESYYFSPTNRE